MGGKNAGESEVARARRAGSAPPRWRVHESHARPHPPGRPAKQAVPPAGEDARNETRAAHKQTSETRLQADATAHLGNNIGQESRLQRHRKDQESPKEKGPEGLRPRLRVRIQNGGRGREGPAETDLPSAPLPDCQGNAGVQRLEHDFRRDEIAFARDGFAERAQNGQRVSVGSPIGAPDDRSVGGDVLSEERGEVSKDQCRIRQRLQQSAQLGHGLVVLRQQVLMYCLSKAELHTALDYAQRESSRCVWASMQTCRCITTGMSTMFFYPFKSGVPNLHDCGTHALMAAFKDHLPAESEHQRRSTT